MYVVNTLRLHCELVNFSPVNSLYTHTDSQQPPCFKLCRLPLHPSGESCSSSTRQLHLINKFTPARKQLYRLPGQKVPLRGKLWINTSALRGSYSCSHFCEGHVCDSVAHVRHGGEGLNRHLARQRGHGPLLAVPLTWQTPVSNADRG